jgi:hypothetical protein
MKEKGERTNKCVCEASLRPHHATRRCRRSTSRSRPARATP